MRETDLVELARHMARSVSGGTRIFLRGGLGAGKSVFARALLRELGVDGSIPSPSFVIDAVYSTGGLEIHHIDLYRLDGSPEELEFYGIDQILGSSAVSVVEWADRLESHWLAGGWTVDIAFTSDPLEREVSVNGRIVAGYRDIHI